MKLNIVNVLNQIESENATMALLLDPCAFWNRTNETELREEYLCYKHETEWDNDDTWDLIDYAERHGYDYSHWLERLKKVLSYDEWLAVRMQQLSKYLVS